MPVRLVRFGGFVACGFLASGFLASSPSAGTVVTGGQRFLYVRTARQVRYPWCDPRVEDLLRKSSGDAGAFSVRIEETTVGDTPRLSAPRSGMLTRVCAASSRAVSLLRGPFGQSLGRSSGRGCRRCARCLGVTRLGLTWRFVAFALLALVVGLLLVVPTGVSTSGRAQQLEFASAPPSGHVQAQQWVWLTVLEAPSSVLSGLLVRVFDAPSPTGSLEWVQMRRSTLAASGVASALLGERPPSALLVVDAVHPEASPVLAPGDVITHVDESPVVSLEEFARVSAGHAGDLPVTVVRDGQRRELAVPLVSLPSGRSVGWMLASVFAPAPPLVDTKSAGGASAGLLFALVHLDAMFPGDLTGGYVVAATGELGVDGQVWPVSGVELKVPAALDAGVDVVFVPSGNAPEALAAAAGAVPVVAVDTVDDALAWLCNRSRQQDPVCGLWQSSPWRQ